MSLLKRLGRIVESSAPLPSRPEGIGIDIGCGAKKHPGTQGLDIVDAPGVDHVLDFTKERFPFEDESVSFVFSSHCVEHIADPHHLFKEITRVAKHGASLEIWCPYAFHEHAFLPGHVSYWTEAFYRHLSFEYTEVWDEQLGGGWRIDEVILVVQPEVERYLRESDVSLDFATRHLNNVVFEMGVVGFIDKRGGPPRRPRIVASTGRQERRRPLVGSRIEDAAKRLRGLIQK